MLQVFAELKKQIRRKWLLIFSVSLLVALVQAWFSWSEKGVYETHSKIFPLSMNKGGSGSPLDAIKMQFGISDKTDYEKIYNVTELVNSKTLSVAIVKTKPANKKFNTLAEWLVDDYNKNRRFWKDALVVDRKDTETLFIQGAGLLLGGTVVENDIKTGFTTIRTRAHDELLALEMNRMILQELSDFYIQMATEKPRTDLERIAVMRDSLKRELSRVERSISEFIDSNQYSVKSETQLPQFSRMRSQKEIEELYTITATSYQNAKFKLLSESPIFQILDHAGAPYDFQKPNWKKNAVMAFIVTAFLMMVWVNRSVFRQALIQEFA